MLGGKNRQPLGYTIVEVMVVLAISGVMFLIAATFINGKAQNTAFRAGVNQLASQIQNVIEQVTDGQYSDIDLTCPSETPPSATQVNDDLTYTNNQGTDSNCVFLGKIIRFNDKDNLNDYDIFSVAGQRLPDFTQSINASYPSIISQLTITPAVPQQLNIPALNIVDTSGNCTTSFALGFFQSMGTSTTNANGTSNQGAQEVDLMCVAGVASGNHEYQDESPGSIQLETNLKPAQSADICLNDGTNYAEITLGVTGGQLSANVKIDGTTEPPACTSS